MEIFKFTFRILMKKPLRSLLTAMQMGLGVWIVAIILSLNFQGVAALQYDDGLENTLAKINICLKEENKDEVSTRNMRSLDTQSLIESENIESAFICERVWGAHIKVDGIIYKLNAPAQTSVGYAEGMRLEFLEGNFFTQLDLDQQNRVTVISETISNQLFPQQSSIGKTIWLQTNGSIWVEYEVIGVYENIPSLFSMFLSPTHMVIPLTVFHYEGDTQVYELDDMMYNEIYIRSNDGKIYDAVSDARMFFEGRFKNDHEIHIEYFGSFNEHVKQVISIIAIFLSTFAVISIAISAIGVLSIMLVSVVERSREISLRKALGASNAKIMAQILNESLVLSLFGVLIGLILAGFTAKRINNLIFPEIPHLQLGNLGGLHPKSIFISIILAVVMGQLFALYPAVQGIKKSFEC